MGESSASPIRTALVTGATSGIGFASAKALADAGYRVIGTSRNADSIAAEARIPSVTYLPLQLEEQESIEQLARDAGDVDILINNAGESHVGAFEELPIEEIRRLFELNVFSAVHLTQLLLPGMRERGYGRIVMIGSMQASFPMAIRSSYSASKAAIKAFSDCARYELSPFGIWTSTIEPGAINTGLSERRLRYPRESSPYADTYQTISDAIDGTERNGIDPAKVANKVLEAVQSRRPKPLYAVGSSAPAAYTMLRLFPRAAMLKTVARKHGLKV